MCRRRKIFRWLPYPTPPHIPTNIFLVGVATFRFSTRAARSMEGSLFHSLASEHDTPSAKTDHNPEGEGEDEGEGDVATRPTSRRRVDTGEERTDGVGRSSPGTPTRVNEDVDSQATFSFHRGDDDDVPCTPINTEAAGAEACAAAGAGVGVGVGVGAGAEGGGGGGREDEEVVISPYGFDADTKWCAYTYDNRLRSVNHVAVDVPVAALDQVLGQYGAKLTLDAISHTAVCGDGTNTCIAFQCHNKVCHGIEPCCILMMDRVHWKGCLHVPHWLADSSDWRYVRQCIQDMPQVWCKVGMASHASNPATFRQLCLDLLVATARCLGPKDHLVQLCEERDRGENTNFAHVMFETAQAHKAAHPDLHAVIDNVQLHSRFVSYLLVAMRTAFEWCLPTPAPWWEPIAPTTDITPLQYLDPARPMAGHCPQQARDILEAFNQVLVLVVPEVDPRTRGADREHHRLNVCLLRNMADTLSTVYGGHLVLKDQATAAPLVRSLMRAMLAVVELSGPSRAFYLQEAGAAHLHPIVSVAKGRHLMGETTVDVSVALGRAVFILLRAQGQPVFQGCSLRDFFAAKGLLPQDNGITFKTLGLVLRAMDDNKDHPEWSRVWDNLCTLRDKYLEHLSFVAFPSVIADAVPST